MVDLYVEIQPDGNAAVSVREVGLDSDGRVVHRSPSAAHRFGGYGFFDPAVARFPLDSETSDLSAAEFETLWSRPDVVPPPAQLARQRGFIGRVRQELARAPRGAGAVRAK